MRVSAVLLSLLVVAALTQTAGASTKGKLHWAERRLRELEHDISSAQDALATAKRQVEAAQARVHALQLQLNALAAKVTRAEGAYERTRAQISETHDSLVAAKKKYNALRAHIDARAHDLYEQGPASSLEFVFGATSLADLTDRVEFVNALNSQDAMVANETEQLATKLQEKQAQLVLLRAREKAQLRELRDREHELNAKFSEQSSLLSDLNAKREHEASLLSNLADSKSRIAELVGKFRKKLAAEERAAALAAQQVVVPSATLAYTGSGPFKYCPVGYPHAYSDSFGAPRYAGGYHPHAGTDIIAPRNTPIVATFDGYAYADPNGLGGLAVIVRGSEGYTYNAHLDHYGNLGSVSAGTVIGYVGNSGDAQGGVTHDHFEWHPNVIPSNPYRSSYGYTVIDGAIDAYPYLNQVC